MFSASISYCLKAVAFIVRFLVSRLYKYWVHIEYCFASILKLFNSVLSTCFTLVVAKLFVIMLRVRISNSALYSNTIPDFMAISS